MDLKMGVIFAAFVTICRGTNGENVKRDEDNHVWVHTPEQFQRYDGRTSDDDTYLTRLTTQRQPAAPNINQEDAASPLPQEPFEFQQALNELARIKNNRKKIHQAVFRWNSSVPKKVDEASTTARLKYASGNTNDYVSNEDLLEKYNNLEGVTRKQFAPIKIGFQEPNQSVVNSNIDPEPYPSVQELIKQTLNQDDIVKDTPHVNQLTVSPGEHVYARFNQNFQPEYVFPSENAWPNRKKMPEYMVNDKANSQVENGNNNGSGCRCRKSLSVRDVNWNNGQRLPRRRVRLGARSGISDIIV